MQKIAILGGGIGALATAAELTNDPDWQRNYDITIYQMGWRLGGKGAKTQPSHLRPHPGARHPPLDGLLRERLPDDPAGL